MLLIEMWSMQLSKQNIKNITPQPGLVIPGENLFNLPEKVLQFGTGVLLRGLPDYFIDKANRKGIFNGRVVVVKSTSSGGTDAFTQQDGLYTLCVRGIENNKQVEELMINSSISRVLSANEEWKEVLLCAHNPEMRIIVSNTTEVGITLSNDDIHAMPPPSFPGKLLAFLYERYKTFKGTAESGMIIIPTELIVDNGKKLRSIVLELATINQLDDAFINWLRSSNHFCNSLVDRIVPGRLSGTDKKATEKILGYTDDLMIMAEPFCLWAVESDNKKVKELLSFAEADERVVIAPSIEKFRELKLRLLNGTHSFSCGLAFLAGFHMVKEVMNNEEMSSFIRQLMLQEIVPSLLNENISYTEALNFANQVMDRFRNPFLDHKWLSISLNYTSKMKQRNIPLLLRHFSVNDSVPEHMALGFAAYLLFMKCKEGANGQYFGNLNGTNYVVEDEMAAYFAEKWKTNDADVVTNTVLADKNLWGTDLSILKGFSEAIKENIQMLVSNGSIAAISKTKLKKTVA
jgi:tagaturonate reductase